MTLPSVLDPRQQLRERDGLSAGGRRIRTLGLPLPRECRFFSPRRKAEVNYNGREKGPSLSSGPAVQIPVSSDRGDIDFAVLEWIDVVWLPACDQQRAGADPAPARPLCT